MTKRILFVVGPALGHVVRSIVIANALVAKGSYQILFAGVQRGHGQRVLSERYPFYELPDKDKDCIEFADGLEILIDNLLPDLICFDLTPNPWLQMVRFPNILQVYLTNFFLTHVCSYMTFQEMLFKNSEQRVNEIRKSRGLKPIIEIKQLYNKHKVILCDPADLIASDVSLPSNFFIAGPCVWEPIMELPEELKDIKEFLFISLGSTGIKPLPLAFVEEVANTLNIQNIIWLGYEHLQKIAVPGTLRHRFYSWLPASSILANSKFVITQGGAGSTYQALAHGKPVGVWPSHQNQDILGSIVQDFGCGALLDIATGADPLKKNRFIAMKSRSEELAQCLSNVSGSKNAANMIASML